MPKVSFYALFVFLLLTNYIAPMKQLIKQHNILTQARYSMTSLEKNVVYLLMSLLEDVYEPGKKYKIAVCDLEQATGTQINHVQFKEATTLLVDRVLSANLSGSKFIDINLLSSGEYMREKGFIELELSKEMASLLFSLKQNFTVLRLNEALGLKSKYSKRFYEMLCQYRDTKKFHVSVEELKTRLALTDKYEKFGLFKEYVLEVARREIEEKTSFSFSYQVIKTGKRYTHLSFHIKEKGNITQLEASSQNTLLQLLMGKYELSEWQANEVVKKVQEQEIHKTLYMIQLSLSDKRIKNIGGYTAKVFEEKYKLGLLKNAL